MAHQKRWSGQVLSISEKPIISVKEARKILGKDYEDISDDDLMGTIVKMYKIAQSLLAGNGVPNNQMV